MRLRTVLRLQRTGVRCSRSHTNRCVLAASHLMIIVVAASSSCPLHPHLNERVTCTDHAAVSQLLLLLSLPLPLPLLLFCVLPATFATL